MRHTTDGDNSWCPGGPHGFPNTTAWTDQETNRDSESSVVDDKTAWELYYPPFEAAVDAGGVGFMCSYNKDDGVFSCSNHKRLVEDLKGKMGFEGFGAHRPCLHMHLCGG